MMPDPTTCSASSDRKSLPRAAWRMMGLQTAGELLGQKQLAEAMSIDARTLRYKIDAGRGVSDVDLTLAAAALEARAARLWDHAQRIRAEMAREIATA